MNDHPCLVCGAHVAAFGYGPAGAKVREEPHKYQWYCGEHRPEGKPPRVMPKVEVEEVECPF